MGDIIREHAVGVDKSGSDRKGGGLVDRARGVLDTATGQDIRKFEEFVEAATTVLVGVHRDQESLRGEVTGLEESVRQRQDDIDERIGSVDEKLTELREELTRFGVQRFVHDPHSIGRERYRPRPVGREHHPEVRVMSFDEITELATSYPRAGRRRLVDIGQQYRRRHEREVLELAAIAADVGIDDLTNIRLEPDENPLLREASIGSIPTLT